MKKPVITVVGSINMDLVTVAKKAPAQGETILGERFHQIPGGKGANQAVACARLGAEVHMIGAVGDDSFGSFLKQHLEKEGIHVTDVKPVTHTETGIASITISEGDNRIIVVPGANAKLTPEDVAKSEEIIAKSDMCVIQLEIPIETVEMAAKLAKKHGVNVILNPAPAQPLPSALIQSVDWLTPNEHERPIVLQHVEEKDVFEKLITTEGKKGVKIMRNGTPKQIKGFTVPVVDTTGAGDTFNGALAVALSKGMEIEDACRFANAAAALSVTKLGAQSAMPTEEAVYEFLKTKGEGE